MDTCTRCNWSGPAGLANCPRCGQPLGASTAEPTVVQMGARPVLLLKLLGGELPPEEWEIEGVPVGIGRLDDSDITLPHRSVSRHHARIVPSANGYEVEDLGSTNGTWLNDKPLDDRVALSDGDSLMVGDIPLVVELIQPQRQAPPEIIDIPQLPAGSAAPGRAPQAPEGGASTVFYELDAALAAAGPAEPAPPPLQPAQPPADYQRAPPPLQPAPAPTVPAPTVPANTVPATTVPVATVPVPTVPTKPEPPLQPAQPPADYQRTPPPMQPAQPPADYQRAPPPPPPPMQPAQPPAGYQRAQRPADYQQAPPPIVLPAQPPAGYRRTPSPATPAPVQPPPAEVEVPRAWDDTPSTRLDLPGASDLAENDEHPTIIGQVPVEQLPAPPASAPLPQREARPTPLYTPVPTQTTPPSTSPTPATTPLYTPVPTQTAPSSASPTPATTPIYTPVPTLAPPRTAQPTPSAPAASGSPDLSAAGLIDLAEHLATALRVLKGDLALGMWLFEHAGGPVAAQEFVDYARGLQADPNNLREQADVLESAPGAARLLEAAILLVNVLRSSLDPAGGVDNQLEADAPDLQPVARS